MTIGKSPFDLPGIWPYLKKLKIEVRWFFHWWAAVLFVKADKMDRYWTVMYIGEGTGKLFDSNLNLHGTWEGTKTRWLAPKLSLHLNCKKYCFDNLWLRSIFVKTVGSAIFDVAWLHVSDHRIFWNTERW